MYIRNGKKIVYLYRIFPETLYLPTYVPTEMEIRGENLALEASIPLPCNRKKEVGH